MPKPLHLIQPVGFSLPNIVCALAHDRINSATLLYTSEIPVEHIHRAIEIANECRNSPISPRPNLIRTPSPDVDATEQFNAVQQINMPQDSDVVVGVTGGTQLLMGTLLARFGTDRVLWVSNEPKVVLQIGKERFPEELELDIEDFQRLYGLENNPVPNDRTSISNGRLSFSHSIFPRPYPAGAPSKSKRLNWAKSARTMMGNVAKEIAALEMKFGRIQFHYNLNVTVQDDVTRERIATILGRLPKSVNININGKRLDDSIEAIAIQSTVTQSHIATGFYEIVEANPPLQGADTLHLLVGKYNSITVANSIANHNPKRICLWALNHEGDEAEVQSLCNQVFTIRGWLKGSLGRDMGIPKLPNPKCTHPPEEVFFMNTSVDGIEGVLEELFSKNDLGDTIIDVSSGSGQLSSLLIKAISDFSPNPTITYTHPWTGDIANLSTGKLHSGTGLPIVDRLWLSQRPVIKYEESVTLNQESMELLHEIAERARDTVDNSISYRAKGGKTSHTLPIESWGDISVRQLKIRRKRPKKPERIEYRRGDTALEFQMPALAQMAGYWIDDMMRYAIPHHFQPLDCITSISIMTERKENTVPGIEIDAIFMQSDGLTFVSCKRGKEAWNMNSMKETLSWETLIGGPNSKSIIVHSNRFNPDTESSNASWMKNDGETIQYLHWFDLLGVEFEMLNPRVDSED